MAFPHHDAHEHHDSTYVEERDGVSAIVITLGVILLVGLLVWLFAFSGVIFDRDANNTPDNVNIENTDQGGGGGTDTTDTTNTDTDTTNTDTTQTEPQPS
jgi:hypothetical protein